MDNEVLQLLNQLLENQNTEKKQSSYSLLEDALLTILSISPDTEEAKRAYDSAIVRKQIFEKCESSKLAIEVERRKCSFSFEGFLYWWKAYCFTADPRPTAPTFTVPFVPYDFQVEAARWIWDLVYVKHEDGAIAKSRDVGMSWLICAFIIYNWLFSPKGNVFNALIGSRKEDFVDNTGDLSTLFEKLRFIIARLPKWQLPAGFSPKVHLNYMKIINPETGATISGESSNPNFGRAGRYTIIVFDEHAFFPNGGYEAWTASSESTRTRLAISTPQGKNNRFAELCHTPGFNVLKLHWSMHPFKDIVWYEKQKARMNSAEIAQELEIDFQGSLAGKLFPMYSELHHVITWSEFAAIIGEDAIERDRDSGSIRYRIPRHWRISVGHDWGTTLQHPCVAIWSATAAQDSSLAGSVFLYREIVIPENAYVSMAAQRIKEAMQPDSELTRGPIMLMSHEARSEMLSYNLEYELPFESWKTDLGYTQGIAQIQDYLAINPQEQHPFRKDVVGRPRLYIIVEDGQGGMVPSDMGITIENAIDEKGFARLRKEIPMYHIPQSEAGKPAKMQRPMKLYDDAIDCVRAMAAQFWPSVAELTNEQKIDNKMPKHFKKENLADTLIKGGVGATHAYLDHLKQLTKTMEAEEGFAYYELNTGYEQYSDF